MREHFGANWGFYVYLVLVVGLVLGLIRRMVAKAGRFPLGQDVTLMRRAGETLERRIGGLGEKYVTLLGALIALPLLAAWGPLMLTKWSSGPWVTGLLVAALCLWLAVMAAIIGRILGTVSEVRNLRLGLFGERAAGDQLETLRGRGFAVFHDVPCLGGGGKFNLDHVVVGQGMVTVVETKTYRKPKEGDAKANARVEYDGEQLIWPGRRSREELEQVDRNGQWLEQFCQKERSLSLEIKRMLVIPGWYVVTTRPGPVMVLNQKMAASAIAGVSGPLTAKEEDLLRRRLTALCSDVNFESVT